jgi:acyl-CoA thioester hydrolase
MKNNELNLRLDWSEMDLFGHINNVSYFKYLQASRVHFWESLGFDRLHKERNIGPSLAKTSCAFLRPLHYPGNIRIEVFVDWIKNSSFQLHHFVYDSEDHLCAEGEDIVVLFDYTNNRKHLLPEEHIALLDQYLRAT